MFALLPAQRGLSIAQVGAVFSAYTATAAILELPTGTLADVIGRRPVLIAAAVLETACFAGFLAAHTVTGFCLAMVLGGAGRALNSGALEAWYVDGLHALRPNADVRRPVGTAMTLTNVAVLAGALTVTVLPYLTSAQATGLFAPAALPFLIAAASGVPQVAAVLLLVREPRRGGTWRAALRALRGCPAFARDSVRVAVQHRGLRLLLTAGIGVGVGIGAVETFWQPEFARLLGDPARATGTLGALVIASTVAGIAGGLLAARAPDRFARHQAPLCAVLLALIGAAVAGMALAPSFAVAAAAFVCVYLFLEMRAPLAQALLHRACPPGRRASVLSAYSMSTNAGALLATAGLGAALGGRGVGAIWLTAAAVVAVAGLAYLPRHVTAPADHPRVTSPAEGRLARG
ncbi:hypothetical protein Cme02nite_04580 [Catellatospora methionotrophica]|uniref:Major facilitator superfamily (MFS) profile domain-containing protein n=1 Tax=Catellatospora methionotrophica TaxID=121620 RepID=A0A8J3LBS1_9ACTN|nr:hypothetical protein Cme02nite_04580 [Catellatospora methionotrophica]